MTGKRRLIGSFLRDEHATATMEFVIMFPVVMTIFIAVFESGIILTRQVLLERSVDEAVRLLRIAEGATLTNADIEEAICRNTRVIQDCENILVVDLRIIDDTTYEIPMPDVACVNRNNMTLELGNGTEFGENNELILLRACAIVDRILPFSGFGLNLVRDDTGGLHMTAASVFVNEPDYRPD